MMSRALLSIYWLKTLVKRERLIHMIVNTNDVAGFLEVNRLAVASADKDGGRGGNRLQVPHKIDTKGTRV